MIVHSDPEFERLLTEGAAPATRKLLALVHAAGLALPARDGWLHLPDGMEVFDAGKIIAAYGPGFNPDEIKLEIFRQIGSTNDHIMAQLGQGDHRTHIALAEMQSAGKGRRGRSWVSPFGRNIYVTLGRNLCLPHNKLGGLSLMAGMQVVQALQTSGLESTGLKWPNDVLLDGGKLAGILVELQPSTTPSSTALSSVAGGSVVETGVAIGIGINLMLEEDDAAGIDQPWSQVGSSVSIDRNQLAGDLMQRLVAALALFEQKGFAPFSTHWVRYNLFQGQSVSVTRGNQVIEGIDRGITDTGDLLLETEQGLLPFNAGEVSLRPTD